MLYINKKRSIPGPVHLGQLARVREHHMPAHVVRFAEPCQLARVAHETACKEPELLEEAHFVMHEELHRRQQLADTSMRILEGSQRNG